jgi:hypothetical protein
MSTEKARMRLVSAFEDPSVVAPSTSIATEATTRLPSSARR